MWLNLAMFSFFKRDPVRQAEKEVKVMLQIPVELIGATGETFANACAGLVRVNLNGKFDENALFTEICAYHVKTVIMAMNRVAGIVGGMFAPGVEEAFDRNARFLVTTISEILSDARSRRIADTQLMNTLTADGTLQMAAEYYTGMHGVSDEDVLDFARKYNPKLLSLSSDDRANSVFAYVIRAVRITHVEDLTSADARTTAVGMLNDTLMAAVLELESKVENLAPKG